MQNTIVKTFIGKHIDLSKVVAISDACFIDEYGYDGFYVGFTIDVQLRDEPIQYMRKLNYDEYTLDTPQPQPLNYHNKPVEANKLRDGENQEKLLAVRRLQNQIDELVEQWKNIYA